VTAFSLNIRGVSSRSVKELGSERVKGKEKIIIIKVDMVNKKL
jgi:hypothetical protein